MTIDQVKGKYLFFKTLNTVKLWKWYLCNKMGC